MMFNKNEEKIHFVYITDEDVKKETLKLVDNIKEEDKSIFVFNGESLYQTKGRGHSFVYGWYLEYVTKSGIRATQYASGLWIIGNEQYTYKNDNFELLPNREVNETLSFDKLAFPSVKQLSSKLISGDIISVIPK
jgi:hypothetical protein